MRKRKTSKNNHLSVHAISGTEVVLLGMNPSKDATDGLLGFTVKRRSGKTGTFITLNNDKRYFKGVHDKALKAGRRLDSSSAPIQAMLWGDYEVDPGTYYTYRIIPVYGTPGRLKPDHANAVDVYLRTENPNSRDHAVYFNGGVAINSAYSERYKQHLKYYPDPELSDFITKKKQEEEDLKPPAERKPVEKVYVSRPYIKPADVEKATGSHEAYDMLSRGMEKAMLDFIGQAKGPRYALHAVLFELTYVPVIEAFVDALERGAKVQVLHHAKHENQLLLKQDHSAVTTTSYVKKVGKKKVADTSRAAKAYSSKYVLEGTVPDSFLAAAEKAIGKVGMKKGADKKRLKAFDEMFPRRLHPTSLSHNKVIILLKDNKPVQVWTGSTNVTEGGIFGQSNVAHVVRDPKVAKAYNEYWKKLKADLPRAPKKPNKKTGKGGIARDEAIASWTVDNQPDLPLGEAPPKGTTAIFSPRETDAMLQWYAERMSAAERSVFFTAAFSVADPLFNKIKHEKPVTSNQVYQRYLLLDGQGVGDNKDQFDLVDETPFDDTDELTKVYQPKFDALRACRQNRIAWGDILKKPRKGASEADQFKEALTGLNHNVKFIHTKFMLLDPLSDDPVVITGSANFSDASTKKNDENMLIIRGNKRVADIYLTEFMRLFNYFQSRNVRNERNTGDLPLRATDSWTRPYYDEGSQEWNERLLFG